MAVCFSLSSLTFPSRQRTRHIPSLSLAVLRVAVRGGDVTGGSGPSGQFSFSTSTSFVYYFFFLSSSAEVVDWPQNWFQFHFATPICLPLHIHHSLFTQLGPIVGQGYGEKTRTETAVPHSAKRSTARLIRDDRLRECIPHVLRWSCLVSRGFINWQRHAPAQQDGVTLFKSRIFTCVYRPGSLPSHCPFGLVCFNCVFTDPCPALTSPILQ